MGSTGNRARDGTKGSTSDRVGSMFVALPYLVLESPSYRAISPTARALLTDVAMKFYRSRKNNGKLVCCPDYLAPLGWRSAGTVQRAKDELLSVGLLIKTREGSRNKAAWYALPWHHTLCTDPEIECSQEAFLLQRTRFLDAPKDIRPRRKPPKAAKTPQLARSRYGNPKFLTNPVKGEHLKEVNPVMGDVR